MVSKVNNWLSNNYAKSESDLIDSLVVEAIQIKGVTVRYIMRDMLDRDYLFGESTINDFSEYIDIEMYLKDVQDFDGNADLFSQFGFEATTSADFEVSCSRFKEELKPYNITRPREGDLIYLPFSEQLFEIKKINNDDTYYQLNKNYRYVLKTQLFNYSHEQLPEELADIQGQSLVIDEDELSRTLGLVSTNFQAENEYLQEEAKDYKTFDPNNPFGL